MAQFIRTCEWCSSEFTTEWETKIYCSRQHKEAARDHRVRGRRTKVKTIQIRFCKGCATEFHIIRADQLYCSSECREWTRKQVQKHRDKEFLNAKTPALKRRLYFKTNGRCGICHEVIDLACKYPDPMSFSIDHIVPRSQGGTHGFNNLQPAHLACNYNRQDKPLTNHP
jgi:5-methylcytosine-specific restriction endonuclease McrA